jgi:hypothetical protein
MNQFSSILTLFCVRSGQGTYGSRKLRFQLRRRRNPNPSLDCGYKGRGSGNRRFPEYNINILLISRLLYIRSQHNMLRRVLYTINILIRGLRGCRIVGFIREPLPLCIRNRGRGSGNRRFPEYNINIPLISRLFYMRSHHNMLRRILSATLIFCGL